MSARVRYRCVLKGHPGPMVEEGVLGWEVYQIDGEYERLIGMYFAHRDRLHRSGSHWRVTTPMPDIERVINPPYWRGPVDFRSAE